MQQSRTRQISPLSMESNDSSFLSRYQTMNPADNPYGAARPQQTSPPMSHHHSENSLSGRPSNRSPQTSNGHISSSSSNARSSEGNGLNSPVMSDSGRSMGPRQEESLQEHYGVLKRFLAPYLQQEASGARPTRARDKLLRLSATQFHELSTDVYDEFLRREDDRRRRGQDVPKYLLPKTNFHPKRNQARQKLSTLPGERFRQLATDVFYELERRIPRLAGSDIDRVSSPAVSVASSQRGPSRAGQQPGMRGPPGPPGGLRPPPPGTRGPAQQYNDQSAGNEFGRPLPKTFQSNTMIPNKSTMVEDDETEDEDESFGLEKVVSGLTKRSTDKSSGSEQDREHIRAYEAQIAELQEKMAGLEDKVLDKDTEIERMEASRREREHDLSSERGVWEKQKSELEQQLSDLQESSRSFQDEMNQMHQSHSNKEADLHEHMNSTVSELHAQLDDLRTENSALLAQRSINGANEDDEEWRERCHVLQEELAEQQKLTEDVRHNATQFLQEMRLLSEQSEIALEKEEELRSQIAALEGEVGEWKDRYAKTKTQLRTLKASSIGLPLQRMASDALASRQELLSEEGLVNDVDVTNFQMSIDELLQTARKGSSEATLDKMKSVISNVQHITADMNAAFTGLPSPASSPNPMSPDLNGSPPTTSTLRGRVSRNANSLITATRHYASANGLSPVSLLDAAASNLTSAVVDYLKTVGIRASHTSDLNQDMEVDDGYTTLAPTTHVPALNTTKSAPPRQNGWFNRLKGSIDSTYSNEAGRDDEDDYDNYR